MAGPFEILEQVRHLYCLKLPESIKVYNIFSPDCLQKAANNPLPSQINNPLPPIIIDNKQE
jgi:hypothetical protein